MSIYMRTGCARGGDEEIRLCDMEEFCRLKSSEKTIAILGDSVRDME